MRIRRSKSFIVVLVALLVAGAAVTVAAAAVISQQAYAEGDGLHYRFEKRTTDASGPYSFTSRPALVTTAGVKRMFVSVRSPV